MCLLQQRGVEWLRRAGQEATERRLEVGPISSSMTMGTQLQAGGTKDSIGRSEKTEAKARRSGSQ